MGNQLVGHGSIWKVDPDAGASYVEIENQLDATITLEADLIESTDKSGNQHRTYEYGNDGVTGTITGNITSDPLLNLDGSTEYAHVADHADFDLTTAIRIRTTIIPASLSGAEYLVDKHDGTDGYRLRRTTNQLEFTISNSGSTSGIITTTDANLQTGKAYTIIAVYEGGGPSAAIYLNGTQLSQTVSGTLPASAGVNATRVSIGADAVGADLYAGKLGTTVISADASTPFAPYHVLPSAAAGYWEFNGALTDSSGNGHTLTGVNIDSTDYGDRTLFTLYDAWRDRTKLTLQFVEEGTSETILGTFIVTSITRTAPQNALMGYSASFTLDGVSTFS